VDKQFEEVVFDRLHETAYRGTSLARTILGPEENIQTIKRDDIIEYIDTHYTAPRMVVAAAGAVNHEELVKLVEEHFGNLPNKPRNNKKVHKEPALFTGSDIRLRYDSMPLAHITLAFPTCGWTDPDNFPLMLIQTMLGAWDKENTSVYGPHSSSRMIAQIAEEDVADSVMTFNTQYSDTGLFGVYCVAPDVGQQRLMDIICEEITRLSYDVDGKLLEEAKNKLKVGLSTHLDGSTQIAEDIGRQLLTYGRRLHPIETLKRIDLVDTKAIRQAARRFFYDRDHALAAVGPIYELPDYNYLRRMSYWLKY